MDRQLDDRRIVARDPLGNERIGRLVRDVALEDASIGETAEPFRVLPEHDSRTAKDEQS